MTNGVVFGPRASTRTRNSRPEFLLSVPTGLEPAAYLVLVHCNQQHANARSFLMTTTLAGEGAIPPFARLPKALLHRLGFEKLLDQSRAAENFTLYGVRPKDALPPGEYLFAMQCDAAGPLNPYPNQNHGILFDFAVVPF